jgi:hypothetical protein
LKKKLVMKKRKLDETIEHVTNVFPAALTDRGPGPRHHTR